MIPLCSPVTQKHRATQGRNTLTQAFNLAGSPPAHDARGKDGVGEPIRESLDLLLEAQAVAAASGASVVARRIEEAVTDHFVTGRRYALLGVRVELGAMPPGENDGRRLEGVAALLTSHLHRLLPARAALSRLPGLRFAVLLPLVGGCDEAEMAATGVVAELPLALECRAVAIPARVSAGIALLPQDGEEPLALLAAVDQAAIKGAAAGAAPLQFVGSREDPALPRLVEFELHEAMDKGHFGLLFQPQVHLSTGHIAGFEAVLRWQHPLRGEIPPAEFLPMVEGCGLAGAVTRWMLEQSAAQLRAWEQLGHRGLQMAVDVLPGALEGGKLHGFVLDLLSRFEIAGNQIELQLSERVLTESAPAAIQRLQALRAHGISMAVDHFGAGHSSLSYLTRLPLDCLKLDARFVQGALCDPAQATMARLTGELARALKLRMVADGMETEGQRQLFARLHCDMAQGSLFAAAVGAAEATALLQSARVFQHAQPPQQPQERSRHLLLLDDEPNILRSLRRVFRAQPWTVHTATTPDEAFELLARHPVGVVMSDQRMPLMRGTDFLARVKQLYPDTVRIVLSGYTELQSVTEAINEGAIYKFLTKPWNDQHLNDEIAQAFCHYEVVAESQSLQQRLRESNKLLEARLQKNESRLQCEEAALDVTHEALGVVPVPILGVDASGMIAISNAAADSLLGEGSSVVGEHVSDVLPAEFTLDEASRSASRTVRIADVTYEMRCNGLGPASRGMGTVITLLQGAPS